MCVQHGSRDTFDRLASEYDELKHKVIPGYRQVQDLALRYASANPASACSNSEAAPANGHWPSSDIIQRLTMSPSSSCRIGAILRQPAWPPTRHACSSSTRI